MLAYPTTPKWIDFPAVRSPQSGLEPSLADVDSHLKAGHPYKDSRHITWCRETTHGINAELRNQRITLEPVSQVMCAQGGYEMAVEVRVPIPAGYIDEKVFAGNVNAFYVLGNRGVRLQEPPFKLSDIAKAVPKDLQGMTYQLYLIQQQKYWQDSPLYVLDEFAAYLNGLTCALEGQCKDAAYSDILQPLEFMGYAWTLLGISHALEQSAFTALRDAIAYQTARTVMLHKMAKETPIYNAQCSTYLSNFRGTFDGTIQLYCGLSWHKQVFEEQDFHGIF